MAATYDFRIVVRRAEFARGMVSVPYGTASDVYHEECINCTLADALANLKVVSDTEKRSHAAFLTMKYRDDKKPRGFDASARTIHKEGI